jgi:preprotein translocase subunit SecD
MRRRRGLVALGAIVVVAALALGLTFAFGNSPLLGLDLQGGVSVTLQPKDEVDSEALDEARAIIEQRVNALGVAEPEITRQGDTILVQIPGVKDKDRALELVGQTAELRFRPVLAELPPTGVPTEPPPTEGEPAEGDPADGATTSTVPAEPGATEPGAADAPDDGATAEVDPAPSAGDEQENGLAGLRGAEGEAALGAQDPTTTDGTITEGTDPAATPADGAEPTEPTDTSLFPGDEATSTAQPTTLPTTLPADVCATGVPDDQDLPDQPVVLPLCDRETNELLAVYQLGPTLLTGDSLETARATLEGQTGQWVVNPVFRGGATGIDLFNAAAAQCNPPSQTCPTGRLAIILDARVVSAPSINETSFQRDQIQISGDFTESLARDLATALKYGALPVEFEQQQAQIVSATLGRDALEAGLWAGLVGFLLVAAYMIGFYRLLGVLAICKLAIEGALLWSVIAYLGESQGLALTLAGITGLIVAIGVSVDSNVVYYEHLKEDVRNGRTIRSATDKAFHTSFRTIVAADLSSLIGAFLLWWLTIGAVRGFAFYLGLATVLDLIAAYFFMRPAVAMATKSDLARRRPGWFGLPGAPITQEPDETPRDVVEVGS